MNARLCLVAPLLALAACQNLPQPYTPPVQRSALPEIAPSRPMELIWLADSAKSHIVRDIDREGPDVWFWTGQRPAVRVHTGSDVRLSYSIEFLIPDEFLAQTGSVTVSYLVNDRVIDHAQYTSPGHYFFKRPIPEGWLKADQDVVVSAEIDKTFLREGVPSGFQLSSLGLLEE